MYAIFVLIYFEEISSCLFVFRELQVRRDDVHLNIEKENWPTEFPHFIAEQTINGERFFSDKPQLGDSPSTDYFYAQEMCLLPVSFSQVPRIQSSDKKKTNHQIKNETLGYLVVIARPPSLLPSVTNCFCILGFSTTVQNEILS